MGKTGLVDVGGGFRGIYAAAVLDHCLEEGIRFDVCIGVSAGSANIVSFLAGQKGRNYRFYAEYGKRRQYASLLNFITKRSFLDLDYVYGTLSDAQGEDPVDEVAFMADPSELVVVATDARTGGARYFTKADIRPDDYSILKASCAIPGVCHPYEVDGVPYYDGALADPVPVRKALSMGCDQVVVLLTKPRDERRTSDGDERMARLIRRKHPQAAEALCQRARRYNEGVDFAKELERDGRALIVAPDDTCDVSTLTRDTAKLDALYAKGFADGARLAAELSQLQ